MASELTLSEPFTVICVTVVASLAVARMIRLIVDDEYPPMMWITQKIALRLPEKWDKLVECPWCVAPYLALPDILWAWGSGLHWSWWLANCWAALSMVASMITVRDIPPDQRS